MNKWCRYALESVKEDLLEEVTMYMYIYINTYIDIHTYLCSYAYKFISIIYKYI